MNAQQRYDEICSDLVARDPAVQLGKMMGMPCVKRAGKMVAGFASDEGAMTFKLPDFEQREAALALDGAHLFDPSGRGRPMKEWAVVPAVHADQWPYLATQALTSTT